MKIKYNVLYLISVLLVVGCNIKKPTLYKWYTEGGAPKNYPGIIYYADFIYEGGSKSVPAGAAGFDNGWGWGGRTKSESPSPLPHRLIAVWVSTTEKQAYMGDFKLDTAKINAIFKKGQMNINRKDRAQNHVFSFKVSTAPGGILAVWLEGILSQVEVGYFKGTKTDKLTWKDLAPHGIDQTLEEYCESIIRRRVSPEIQEQLATTGPPFGLWDSYRKKYIWDTAVLGDNTLIGIEYYHYNGEKTLLQLKEYNINTPRAMAVPYEGWLRWQTREGATYDATLYFKEASIYKVFEQVCQKEGDVAHIVYDISKKNNSTNIKAYLQNENQKVAIEMDSIQVFRHRENL